MNLIQRSLKTPTLENAYTEPVDYSARQDSIESLGTKLGIHKREEGEKDKDKNGPTRRSDRNLDKKDVKIEDFAKERVVEKDNYRKNTNYFNDKISLLLAK